MNCVGCGKSDFSKYSDTSYFGLPVFCCKNCDLYVTGSSENEIKQLSEKLYQDEYWRERKSIDSIDSDYMDDDGKYRRNQWLSQISYCNSYLKNKKTLLEIGSGAGQSLIRFEENGFEVTGIEPDERNVNLINKKLEKGKCICGFLEEIQLEEKFDVIWISHVFEHIVRPDLFLQKCKSMLNPDGFVFIEVPNCLNKDILKSSIMDNPSTFHFTKKAILKMVKMADFIVERCDNLRFSSSNERTVKRIKTKYLNFIPIQIYPFFPFHITNKKNGESIRIILRK